MSESHSGKMPGRTGANRGIYRNIAHETGVAPLAMPCTFICERRGLSAPVMAQDAWRKAQPPGTDGAGAGDRVPGPLGPSGQKSGVHPKDRADRCGDAEPAIW